MTKELIQELIPKENFELYIHDVESVMGYHKELNNFFVKHDVDGYIYQPDCVYDVLKMLHDLFGEADKGEYIETFCYDAGFGSKKSSGLFIGKDGKNVNICSSGELYDFLVSLCD